MLESSGHQQNEEDEALLYCTEAPGFDRSTCDNDHNQGGGRFSSVEDLHVLTDDCFEQNVLLDSSSPSWQNDIKLKLTASSLQ